MKKSISNTLRHIPQRTCVACGKTEAKRQLVRLVRVAGGVVEVDLTGRKTGRGAYLCATAECWKNVLKRDRLEHSLRTAITSVNRERLLQYGSGLEKGAA
jgi:predicted RNA-binding protein YlxR (DUF448 family)